MTNPVKGEVPLVLSDGRAFTLVLDMEALLSIETAVNKPLGQVMAEAGAGFMSSVAAVAQAAFARNHPDVTRAEILEVLFSEDKEALSDALGAATEAAFGKPSAAGNVQAAKPPKRQPGKNSGSNGAKRS